jgi:hypothetical protein
LRAWPPKMVHPSGSRDERRKSWSWRGPCCPSAATSAPRTMLLHLHIMFIDRSWVWSASRCPCTIVPRRDDLGAEDADRVISVRPVGLDTSRGSTGEAFSDLSSSPSNWIVDDWSWCSCESSSPANFLEYQLDSGIGTLYVGNRESNRWGLHTWLGEFEIEKTGDRWGLRTWLDEFEIENTGVRR